MKILRFLLIILFYFSLSIQNLIADEAKMLKGLEIFNETAACAGCHLRIHICPDVGIEIDCIVVVAFVAHAIEAGSPGLVIVGFMAAVPPGSEGATGDEDPDRMVV